MPASKKFLASLLIIVYRFLPDFLIHIALHSLMTTRQFQEEDYSPSMRHYASACQPELQATPLLEPGDSACGMIHSGYHSGLEEVHFVCLRCQMQFGSLERQRKIICRFAIPALRLRFAQLNAK